MVRRATRKSFYRVTSDQSEEIVPDSHSRQGWPVGKAADLSNGTLSHFAQRSERYVDVEPDPLWVHFTWFRVGNDLSQNRDF